MSSLAAHADRFWAWVATPDARGCRIWTGTGGRYGSFKVDNRSLSAHRVAWELTNGPIADGLAVLHRCDVTYCCEPTHLFLGTDATNAADRNAKVRQARGERHGRAKLRREDLETIRGLVAAGASQRSVAARFGVAPITVSRVVNRTTWTWLPA